MRRQTCLYTLNDSVHILYDSKISDNHFVMKKVKVAMPKLQLKKNMIGSLDRIAGGEIKYDSILICPLPNTNPSVCPCIPIDGTVASVKVSNCNTCARSVCIC